MNANWLAPIIFVALGLLFLSMLILHLVGAVPVDGAGQFFGLVMPPILFFLAAIAVREILKRGSADW